MSLYWWWIIFPSKKISGCRIALDESVGAELPSIWIVFSQKVPSQSLIVFFSWIHSSRRCPDWWDQHLTNCISLSINEVLIQCLRLSKKKVLLTRNNLNLERFLFHDQEHSKLIPPHFLVCYRVPKITILSKNIEKYSFLRHFKMDFLSSIYDQSMMDPNPILCFLEVMDCFHRCLWILSSSICSLFIWLFRR